MSAVGSLIFCTDCGNLLQPISKDPFLICEQCGSRFDSGKFQNLKVLTKSSPSSFSSPIREKRSVIKASVQESEADKGAIIHEKCPSCGNDEMQYQTLQLRSADEGATVFYTCTKCGYKFRTNN